MYFYLNDHLGTPQQLLNGTTGAVAWQAAYLPFGEAQVQVSVVTNNLRFPGQYYDAETGLHYNWNRYYDPASGRYISTDPIGLVGGLHLYIYVDNNSINWIDPNGERSGWSAPVPYRQPPYFRQKYQPNYRNNWRGKTQPWQPPSNPPPKIETTRPDPLQNLPDPGDPGSKPLIRPVR